MVRDVGEVVLLFFKFVFMPYNKLNLFLFQIRSQRTVGFVCASQL